MKGLYYKTLSRNERTGETQFLFSPTEACPESRDGLILCVGNIGFYAYKIPLELEGSFHQGVFYVKNDTIPFDAEDGAEAILNYASDALTETQKQKIRAMGNLLDFIKQTGSVKAMEAMGIDKSSARALRKRVIALYQQEETTKYLLRFQLPVDRIEAMIKKGITKDSLRKHTYALCLAYEFGIYVADTMAYDLSNVHPYTIARLNGFIQDAINSSLSNGNTCIDYRALLRIINVKLKKSIFPETVMNLSLLNLCLSEAKDKYRLEWMDDELFIYDTKAWEEETALIQHLKRLNQSKHPMIESVDVHEVEQKLGIKYRDGQRAAFDMLKCSGVKLLIGPPGTGKTATIRGLIYAAKSCKKLNIRLAATTGRAAQVMSAACGEKVETVNKMLDVRPFEDTVSKMNVNNKLDADFIIVDEVSMLGLELASYLFQAVKSGATLLLVGDKDQLQSVDYGSVLSDLMESGYTEVYVLDEIMRQSGAICDNAFNVNHGNLIMFLDSSFELHEFQDSASAKQAMLSQYNYGDQVLSPIKAHDLGTYALNHDLQPKQNSKTPSLVYGQTIYYEGDRIIMLRTDYERGYCNGDMGVITACTEDGLIVKFDQRSLCLMKSDYYFMALAYAITIHKSQGSEFPIVHVLLPDDTSSMLTRRILYTAITRAKKKVIIYSVRQAFRQAVYNTAERPRISKFLQRISVQN